MIKGGQAIAMIYKNSNLMLLHNQCSYSEFLDISNDFKPCPDDHYSDVLSLECKSCNSLDLDYGLKYMCQNKWMFEPFNTRYELVIFDHSKSKTGFIVLIVFLASASCCICFYYCVYESEREQHNI